MSFIVGSKLGMTQFFKEDGKVVPVTIIKTNTLGVTQIKTIEKDGYKALQLGYGTSKNVSKPQKKQAEKANVVASKFVELKTKGNFEKFKELQLGASIDLSSFAIGDKVKIVGISKAKGFQGGVKRHGFSGAPASHGHHAVLRHGGSVGQRFPQHTLKGLRMPGRMGGKNTTVRGLKVVSIDVKNNTLGVSGAVPGRKGTILKIYSL